MPTEDRHDAPLAQRGRCQLLLQQASSQRDLLLRVRRNHLLKPPPHATTRHLAIESLVAQHHLLPIGCYLLPQMHPLACFHIAAQELGTLWPPPPLLLEPAPGIKLELE
jgi:hypothetical protein